MADLGKPGAAFLTVSKTGLLKTPYELEQVFPVSRRKVFQIEELDVIGRRVMLPGDEISVLRNGDTVLRQFFPHQVLVGHERQGARVGIAGIAPAGAAIQGGFEGIVFRGAAVGAKEHQPGEIPGKPHDPQRGLYHKGLFAGGKTRPCDALGAREG